MEENAAYLPGYLVVAVKSMNIYQFVAMKGERLQTQRNKCRQVESPVAQKWIYSLVQQSQRAAAEAAAASCQVLNPP